MSYREFLKIAERESRLALAAGDEAVGAVLIKDGEVVASAHDRRRQSGNPIASAEMECIRRAGRRTDQASLTLLSTGYPDMLTAGTLLQFSIGGLVVGRPEISTPAIELLKSKNLPLTFVESHE